MKMNRSRFRTKDSPGFPVFLFSDMDHPPAKVNRLGQAALADQLSLVLQRDPIDFEAATPFFTTTGIRDIVKIDKCAG